MKDSDFIFAFERGEKGLLRKILGYLRRILVMTKIGIKQMFEGWVGRFLKDFV